MSTSSVVDPVAALSGLRMLSSGISTREAAIVIAILGAVAGWFVAEEDRQRILIAAIALSVVSGALGAIPAVGEHISNVMSSLGNLYAAGSITVILVALYEKLKP